MYSIIFEIQQIVELKGEIFEKPVDEQHAFDMLSRCRKPIPTLILITVYIKFYIMHTILFIVSMYF